jgi:hypothetical protein
VLHWVHRVWQRKFTVHETQLRPKPQLQPLCQAEPRYLIANHAVHDNVLTKQVHVNMLVNTLGIDSATCVTAFATFVNELDA